MDKCYRLRPSVSFVPIDSQEGRYDFFLTNTRRTVPFKFAEPRLIEVVLRLNGMHTLKQIMEEVGNDLEEKIVALLDYLVSRCIVEEMESARERESHPFRRVMNFLGDYIPGHELHNVWHRIQECRIILIGLGAMGSWVATLLAESGFTHYTLVDSDRVDRSNLNRSLFNERDIELPKTLVMKRRLKAMNPEIDVKEIAVVLDDVEQMHLILDGIDVKNALVINCADFPNVDVTSRIISQVCMDLEIPYIIAGGYNLHLSLLGPTCIPYHSACYECMRLTLDEINSPELKNIRKLARPNRNIGNLAPLTGISASFVVNEALRVAAKDNSLAPAMLNRRGEYNFLNNKINFIELPRRSDCSWCSEIKRK
ncbi:MAG: ThiF family adenylyltransferase [Tumebacillaceae bacterium]